MEFDIVVVGAGPAGSSAARVAAQNGAKVLLLEKRQEIGAPKRCGEAAPTTEEFEKLGVKIISQVIRNEIRGYSFYSPKGINVKVVWDHPVGYMLERKMFDKFLAIQAAQAGAQIMVKARAINLLKGNGKIVGVKINHFGEEFDVDTKIVIAADGVESKIARWAGLNSKSLRDATSNVQFEMAGIELRDPNLIEFYFGSKVAPGGYAWIFPKGDYTANVGVGIRGGQTTAFQYLKKFIESKENLRNGAIIEVNVGATPIGGPIEKTVSDNLIAVGDTAGHINPVTGGGIYNAVLCGIIAGEVAAKAVQEGDTSETRLFEYEERWKKAILTNLEKGLRIKSVLEKMSDEELDALAEVLEGKDVVRLFREDPMTVFIELMKRSPKLSIKLLLDLSGFRK